MRNVFIKRCLATARQNLPVPVMPRVMVPYPSSIKDYVPDPTDPYQAGLYHEWRAIREEACRKTMASYLVHGQKEALLRPSFSAFAEVGEEDWTRWCAPPQHGYCFNVDGSLKLGGRWGLTRAGYGGLLRDSMGLLSYAFFASYTGGGYLNIARMELLALHHAVLAAWEMKLPFVIFQTDSGDVERWVNRGVMKNHFHRKIIEEIKSYIDDPRWFARVVLTYREGNFAADFLAKEGRKRDFPIFEFSDPYSAADVLSHGDVFLRRFMAFLVADSCGHWFCRFPE